MRTLNRLAQFSSREGRFRRTQRPPRSLGALLAGVLSASLIAVAPSAASAWGPDNIFHGQTPERLVDTRTDSQIHRLKLGGSFSLDVGTRDGVALNLTAVNPSYRGWLAAYPCANKFDGTSNINFEPRKTIANFVVVVPDRSQKVCFTAGGADPAGTVDVIVDKYGSFEGDGFRFQPFKRVLDTRTGTSGPVKAGTSVKLTGYTPFSTQVLNITVANPQANGHLTVYPCKNAVPETSSSNYRLGINRAATALASPDANGEVCIFSFATTDLIVDGAGEMSSDSVEISTSKRLVDTRDGRGGKRGRDWKVSFPDVKGRAVAINVTAVRPSGPGHVTVYPCSAERPETSMLNYGPGDVVPNFSIVKPDANNQVCIHSFAATELIVDSYGFVGNVDNGPAPTLTCERQDWSIINTWRAQRGVPLLAQYPNDDLFDSGCDAVKTIVLDNGGDVGSASGTNEFGELTIVDRFAGTCDETQRVLLNGWMGVGPLEAPTYTHADMLCVQTDAFGTMTAYWALILAPQVRA